MSSRDVIFDIKCFNCGTLVGIIINNLLKLLETGAVRPTFSLKQLSCPRCGGGVYAERDLMDAVSSPSGASLSRRYVEHIDGAGE